MMNAPRSMTDAIKLKEQKGREDFALRVRGDHPDDKAFRRYVLGELRLAYRRAKLHAEAIHEAAKMVEAGVEPDMALSSIGDALDYVIPTAPEGKHDDAATTGESAGEQELHVRGRGAEIHGNREPDGRRPAG